MVKEFSFQFSSFCPYMKDLSLLLKYPAYEVDVMFQLFTFETSLERAKLNKLDRKIQ